MTDYSHPITSSSLLCFLFLLYMMNKIIKALCNRMSHPGQEPHPDDQGKANTCTRHAVGKALAGGFENETFGPKLNVSQADATLALINKAKDVGGRWPTAFNKKTITVMDMDTKEYYNVSMKIAKCKFQDLQDLQKNLGKSQFVVVYNITEDSSHCVYLREVKNGKLHCINSWGEEDEYPELNLDEVEIYKVDATAKKASMEKWTLWKALFNCFGSAEPNNFAEGGPAQENAAVQRNLPGLPAIAVAIAIAIAALAIVVGWIVVRRVDPVQEGAHVKTPGVPKPSKDAESMIGSKVFHLLIEAAKKGDISDYSMEEMAKKMNPHVHGEYKKKSKEKNIDMHVVLKAMLDKWFTLYQEELNEGEGCINITEILARNEMDDEMKMLAKKIRPFCSGKQ